MTIAPDCPHAVPSLDDPAGWYCTADCGGNCHKGADSSPTAKNDDLPMVAASGAGQLAHQARHASSGQLSHDDLPILTAFSAIDGDGPALEVGAVVWLPMTYYGIIGWHRFTVVSTDLASTRTSIVVDGELKEVVDTLVINDWFLAQAQAVPPKPAAGETIAYQGRAMVVYHRGTTDDHLWLMEPGGTVANVYPWPPIAAALEGPRENPSDILISEGFSDSDIGSSAIAPSAVGNSDSVSDIAISEGFSDFADLSDIEDQVFCRNPVALDGIISDIANSRRSSDFWSECGPYASKGKTYYRYRWGRGWKLEGVRHIPGGALTRLVVANRAYRVHQAVHVEGRSHAEVLAMIDGWRKPRRR
ncbi:hypothetical protein PGN35_025285 [Nodosilinea sp. PGN35]|uniref:hypothetical protein n=1 Tax=Nodosilinea sp. PGN35 TaxID=3020489 RepID=UPI0023B2BEAB|nr:hypothetical protein [Nodosilinea sp. TSF1-S3]MDF0367451.1 hypothetical protein [Nodosilinea sp. TSF1-S3]